MNTYRHRTRSSLLFTRGATIKLRPVPVLVALLALTPALAAAQAVNFAQSPLFLNTSVKPNVLIIYDNSQSMDATMAGKVIAGNDMNTRGNIARRALIKAITAYRNPFNWGLESFALTGNALFTTYPYFFGSDAQVVYTNDCVAGISASNGNLRCVDNPERGNNGFDYITYAVSGDDPSINDVLYSGDFGPQLYGIGINGTTKYDAFKKHGAGAGWTAASFNTGLGTLTFTPTDAGFLPSTPPYSRIFWVKRAWGYNANITGAGTINRAVAADSDVHVNALKALLAQEDNGNAGELKNGAVFTPLTGALKTAKDYFSNTLAGTTTPITNTCQRNFVILATDGNPTGKSNGTMYSLADQLNTFDAVTGTWNFSLAARDVFDKVTALRTTSYGGNNYDVQTYVVGLGDSVANPGSVATFNRLAALGGTNSAILTNDEDALTNAFLNISVDITNKTAAASAVSLNSGSWNIGSKVFQGRFSPDDGWSGQLLAFAIDVNGVPAAVSDWDAAQVLKAQHWSTGRQIMTYKPSAALGSRGVALRWPANPAAPGATEIDAGMVTALNKDITATVDGYGAQRIEFLRGNTARELAKCAACPAPTFRNRPTSVLGDIVNSAPLYIGGATGDFRDTIEVKRYSTYAAARRALTPMIYVGANDGMLHAFNGNTGAEVFAYVPWAVRDRLSALTSASYTHQYTADGSPVVGDAFYGGNWHTLLVSGMGAGVPGFFALDLTDPARFTEANAASVVRWEIGASDADVGHIFGRPMLVKMRDGKWRAIVGNGYNSTNGHAVLLLIDLETGAVTKIDTGAGGTNGLSSVAVVSTADNGVADLVYAGDLNGNLWKFDLSATNPADWKVAYGAAGALLPLFKAADGQRFTARPDVVRFPKGGYLVTLGSGRYIDVADNAAGATQALYGIWDNGAPVAIAQLQNQTIVGTADRGGNTFRLTTHAVGAATDTVLAGDGALSLDEYYATRKGWKMNLVESGERVVADATVRFGHVVVSTLFPNTAVCENGGKGWIMDLDVITGNRSPALDTNGDNVVTDADYLNGTMVSGVRINAVPAAATIMRSGTKNPNGGSLDDKLINTSAGNIVRVRENGNPTPSRRAAWEQIQ